MPRAVWKGTLQVGELHCPVALFTAVSTAERIAFHTINAATGHRVRREYVDSETGRAVPHDDQVKGYDTGDGQTVVLEPDELTAALPENTKTLAVERFLPCVDIDTIFLDRPYYVAPADKVGAPVLALLFEGLKRRKVAALGTALLFRRVRTLLIRADGDGIVASLLKFDDEVRSVRDAFASLPDVSITDEMKDLATHIIKTKSGKFDPKTFDDRYESAVAELVRAKLEGRAVKAPPAPKAEAPIDLLAALRESAKASKPRSHAGAHSRRASPRRKAG